LLVQYTAEAAFTLSISIFLLKLAHVLVVPKGITYLEKGYEDTTFYLKKQMYGFKFIIIAYWIFGLHEAKMSVNYE